MHLKGLFIFLIIFFIALPSYCATNFSAKNVKSDTIATAKPKTTTKPKAAAVVKNTAETESASTKKSETKVEKAAQPAKEVYKEAGAVASTPTYYGSDNKILLDEKTRYIQVPKAGGEGYGMMQEKMIRIKLDSNVSYDSNIFLTKDDTKNDIIANVSPGLYGYVGNENYSAIGLYEADVLMYTKNTKETRINQALGGRLDLFKQGKIKVSLRDSLRPTTDPATSESTPFVRRINNDFVGNARYDISPKTSIALGYEQFLQYYITSGYKGFSYVQHTVSPTFYYHITPKISLTGEYNLGITNYTGGADYNSLFHQARAGIEGTLSPKSRVYLRGGYQFRTYDSSNIKDAQDFVLQLAYDYSISPKTTLQVVASSDVNESVFGSAAYFKSYSIYASLTHHILYNIDLNLNGIYIRSDYPNDTAVAEGLKKRSDDLYGGGAKIAYNMRTWLSAYAGYDFKFRNSNVRDVGYRDDILSGGLKLSF